MDRLEQLKNMKRRLEDRLKDVIRLIEEYERLNAKARSLIEASAPNLESGSYELSTRIFADASTRAKKPEVVEFEAVVRDILSEATAPMDRTEVLEAVRARGVTVSGVEPANTVSARLSRMEDVRSQRGVGYWLVSRADDFAKTTTDAHAEPDEKDKAPPDVFL
jgi:hypothetical protein